MGGDDTSDFVIEAIEVVKNGLEIGENSQDAHAFLVLISLPKRVRITLPCPEPLEDDPTLRGCAPLPAVPTDFGLILRTGSGPGSASVCPVAPDCPASRNIWCSAGMIGRTWRLRPVTSCASPSTTNLSCALSLLLLVFIPSTLACTSRCFSS